MTTATMTSTASPTRAIEVAVDLPYSPAEIWHCLTDEVELAQRTVAWLASRFGSTPLFARVDMVSSESAAPFILELELIEPSLYLGWAAGLDFPGAEAFAAAVIADLG